MKKLQQQMKVQQGLEDSKAKRAKLQESIDQGIKKMNQNVSKELSRLEKSVPLPLEGRRLS